MCARVRRMRGFGVMLTITRRTVRTQHRTTGEGREGTTTPTQEEGKQHHPTRGGGGGGGGGGTTTPRRRRKVAPPQRRRESKVVFSSIFFSGSCCLLSSSFGRSGVFFSWAVLLYQVSRWRMENITTQGARERAIDHAFVPIVIFFQNASRVAGVSVGLVGRDVELDGRE